MLTASDNGERTFPSLRQQTCLRRGPRRRRSGYVLIMTLVLIAVSVLSLASLSRHSLQLASDAIHAQRDLQRYWGTRSCRAYLLENAEEIFYQLDAHHRDDELALPAPHDFSGEFELADMTFRFLLSDENAKLNINSVTLRIPAERDALVRQLSGQKVSMRLQPIMGEQADRTRRWFSSWGQCVEIPDISANEHMRSLWEATSQLTCWGNGKLNIRRVSDQTLFAVASEAATQRIARQLIEAREMTPDADWQYLLKSLGLKRRDRTALRGWFSDRSSCYCLWLELDDGQRRWYHQWVQGDLDATGETSTLSFCW